MSHLELSPVTTLAETYASPAAGLGTATPHPLMGPDAWQPMHTGSSLSNPCPNRIGPAHREPIALLHLASCPDVSSHDVGGLHHCDSPRSSAFPLGSSQWPCWCLCAPHGYPRGCQARPQPDLDHSGPEFLLLLLTEPLFHIICSHSFPLSPPLSSALPEDPKYAPYSDR